MKSFYVLDICVYISNKIVESFHKKYIQNHDGITSMTSIFMSEINKTKSVSIPTTK